MGAGDRGGVARAYASPANERSATMGTEHTPRQLPLVQPIKHRVPVTPPEDPVKESAANNTKIQFSQNNTSSISIAANFSDRF